MVNGSVVFVAPKLCQVKFTNYRRYTLRWWGRVVSALYVLQGRVPFIRVFFSRLASTLFSILKRSMKRTFYPHCPFRSYGPNRGSAAATAVLRGISAMD